MIVAVSLIPTQQTLAALPVLGGRVYDMLLGINSIRHLEAI